MKILSLKHALVPVMAGVCFLVSGIDSRAGGFSDKPPPMPVSPPEESRGQSLPPRAKDQSSSLPVRPLKERKTKETESKEDKSRNIEQQKEGRHGQQDLRRFLESLTTEQAQQLQEFARKAPSMSIEERHVEIDRLFFSQNTHGEQSEKPQKRFEHGQREQTRNQQKKLLTPEQQQQLDDFKQRTKEMTTEQRRQEAANLPLFKEMLPEQRKVLEDRLKYVQGMPTERKEQVLKNYERWQKMSPEEQETCRQRYRERMPRTKEQKSNPSSQKAPPSLKAD